MQIFRKVIFVGLLAFSLAAAALAQDDVNINDGRVNQNQLLGGIGIFCEDQNGAASTNYTNGGISVWSAEGEKYLFASAADIALAQQQFPQVTTTVSGDQAQQGAQGNTSSNNQSGSTTGSNQSGSTTGNTQSGGTGSIQGRTSGFETLRIGTQNTGLLSRAQTNRGQYSLYAAGGETFYLIGSDEYGRQFLYRWTGCSNANSELSSFSLPVTSGNTARGTVTSTPRVNTTPVATTTTPDVTATPEATATVGSGG
jgi:hypothetical protein